MLAQHTDPIVAIATAPGRGAVGILRISGSALAPLVLALCGRELRPREAAYLSFRDATGLPIDQGLALFFPAPHSFTGEDIVAKVVAAASIIDRSSGNADVGVPRIALATLDVPSVEPAVCERCKQGESAVKPGSRTAEK